MMCKGILGLKIRHTWEDGRCVFCGASKSIYDRGETLEAHAYEFIHTTNPEEVFNMSFFDVLISDPPYQLETDGAGRQAKPIYHLLLNKPKLNPRI